LIPRINCFSRLDIQEYQPLGVKPMPVFLPALPEARHFRAQRRAGHQSFLDAQTGLSDKPPHRVINDMPAAVRQFRGQRPDGQIGLLGQAGQQPIPGLAVQNGAAVPTDLAGNLPAATSMALPDPNCGRHRHPEALRCHPEPFRRAANAAAIRTLRSIDSGKTILAPHHPVGEVNQNLNIMGIPRVSVMVKRALTAKARLF
jgi:hypothetical protein